MFLEVHGAATEASGSCWLTRHISKQESFPLKCALLSGLVTSHGLALALNCPGQRPLLSSVSLVVALPLPPPQTATCSLFLFPSVLALTGPIQNRTWNPQVLLGLPELWVLFPPPSRRRELLKEHVIQVPPLLGRVGASGASPAAWESLAQIKS